jgi:xanthine dehydrogenase accessory factor
VLDVFVEPVPPGEFPELPRLADSLAAGEPVAFATIISGPGRLGARLMVWPHEVSGSLGSDRLDEAVSADARGMLQAGSTGVLRYGPDGERRRDELAVFVRSFQPPPRMLVFGAIDFAAAVARMGKFLGYHVTVCDARGVFATPKRFPEADEVDSRTVICVLTHDPKFDVPLLVEALRTDAAYIGAMGSRRTHDERVKRLLEEGVTEDQLARISGPIGLDIGARTPEETAVSIAAEIITQQWGGSGQRLAATEGPIHHEAS